MNDKTNAPGDSEKAAKGPGNPPSDARRALQKKAKEIATSEGKDWKALDREARKEYRQTARKA